MTKKNEREGITAEDAATIYNTLIGEHRDVLAALPHLAVLVANDIRPILTAAFKMVNAIENDELSIELDIMRVQRAEKRMKNLTAYTYAGFTRAEAMQLILYDAEKTSAIVSKAFANKPAADKAKEVISKNAGSLRS
jgi:hypothetical protein